jgi:hypothetical protein
MHAHFNPNTFACTLPEKSPVALSSLAWSGQYNFSLLGL